jgi:hypothetical protein
MTTSIRAAAISISCSGRKLIEPPGECRSNHDLICELAARVGADASGLRHEPARTDRRGRSMREAGHGRMDGLLDDTVWRDVQPDFRVGALSRRFRLAGWQVPPQAGLGQYVPSEERSGLMGPWRRDAQAARSLGGERRTADARASVQASPPARRAISSIRASPRRRRRWPGRGGRAVGLHPERRRGGAASRRGISVRVEQPARLVCVLHARLFDGVLARRD